MSKKLSGKGLVIQLSSDKIRIAKTNLGAAMPQLQASFVADLPEGAVEDGVIHDLEAVREVLKNALATEELRRMKRVVFVLCTTQVIAEETTLPRMAVSKLDKMLQANMDMYFPVETQNYHLTWQLVNKQNDKGEMEVQMWAVSTAIVQPYYVLANSCGLSVLAIDYCGHALANAVDVSFAAPAGKKASAASVLNKPLFSKKKNGEAPAEEMDAAPVAVAEGQEGETELYLMAEPEHLLMLFVRDGQVKLQRMSLCGYNANMEMELDEVVMALDYFESMSPAYSGSTRCILCGSLAEDEDFVMLAREVLNIPVQVLPALQASDWTLCLGAASTTLDFGVPALNQPGGVSQINNAWQYGLILVGGAALILSLATTFGSKTLWTTTINGLESQKQTLQIQAAQNANYAQNYYDYENAYQSYSSDWETIFGAIRTYNDNFSLLLSELEDILPENTSTVEYRIVEPNTYPETPSLQIADQALFVELAAPTKEEAAYTIMALRELRYADLLDISDLVKPTYEQAPTVGSTLDINQILSQLGNLSGSSSSLSGLNASDLAELTKLLSSDDPAELLETAFEKGWITDEALEESPVVKKLLDNVMADGKITKTEIATAIMGLTPEEMDELESDYAAAPECEYTVAELVKKASLEERQNALSEMLNNDPIALYRFFTLFKEDMNRPTYPTQKDPDPNKTYAVLDPKIYDDIINKKDDDGKSVLSKVVLDGVDKLSQDDLAFFVDIIVQKDNKNSAELDRCLTSVEKLISEDDLLENRYACYLSAELDMPDAPDMPIFDVKQVIANIVSSLIFNGSGSGSGNSGNGSGNGNSGNSGSGNSGSGGNTDISDIIGELLGGSSGNDNSGNSGNSGTGNMDIGNILDALLGGGGSSSLFPGGTQYPTQPVDERWHFNVILGYKSELIAAERERKGLDYDAKIQPLDVEVTK